MNLPSSVGAPFFWQYSSLLTVPSAFLLRRLEPCVKPNSVAGCSVVPVSRQIWSRSLVPNLLVLLLVKEPPPAYLSSSSIPCRTFGFSVVVAKVDFVRCDATEDVIVKLNACVVEVTGSCIVEE